MVDYDDLLDELITKYNIFDSDKITLDDFDDFKGAFNEDNDTKDRVKDGTIRTLADTNRAREIAEGNRLPIAKKFKEESDRVKTTVDARNLLVESAPLEEEIFDNAPPGTQSAKIFKSSRGKLEAKQIGSIRALREGRTAALEVSRQERRRIFFEDISSSDDIRLRGRRTVGPLEDVYGVSESEAINRLRNLGFNVDDTGKILR